MRKKKSKIKVIIATLGALLSLSSCGISGKMDQWGIIRPERFGALFNIDPWWFTLSFLGEAEETAKNVSYEIDESKSNYTTRDVLEDTIIVNRESQVDIHMSLSPYQDTVSEQLFSFVYEDGDEKWCDEIKKSEHYDFNFSVSNPDLTYTSSNILKEEYVEELKKDPHVNYLFKFKSTDKNLDGRYMGVYIASGVNDVWNHYTDKGKEYIYKKIENEQTKIKNLWDTMDEDDKECYFRDQKRVFNMYDIIGYDDCDLTKKKYTYLEMVEVNKPAVELKLPYFYDLFEQSGGYSNYDKAETRSLRYDTISTDDFLSGNYLGLENFISSTVDLDNDGITGVVAPGETLQLILKEDILLEGITFEDKSVGEYTESGWGYTKNPATVTIGQFYDFQTDLLKAYNASFYNNFYTNWVSNYNKSLYVIWDFDYTCSEGGRDFTYLEYIEDSETYICHYNVTKEDESEYVVLKKGTPILIQPMMDCSKISDFNLKFKVLKNLKY